MEGPKGARLRREGKDLSIITFGNTVHHSLEAAEKLAEDGYDVEVLDLRSLNPLDTDAIYETVKKTHRVLVAHEDKVFSGFGGEIVATINEIAFESCHQRLCFWISKSAIEFQDFYSTCCQH